MHERPLRLIVADRSKFDLPIRCLLLLALLAAVLSPQPLLLTGSVILFFGAGWLFGILEFYKVNDPVLNTVIHADGNLQLQGVGMESQPARLEGRQWCTRWMTVLRVYEAGKIRRLVVLSSQNQKTSKDYQTLALWLRQGICDDNHVRQVLEI
jgi:hypothetical protein